MLKELEVNPNDIALLSKLQFTIIRYIKADERKLSRIAIQHSDLTKQLKHGRLRREVNKRLKESIKQLMLQRNHVKNSIYYWRCFGDSILFLYLDSNGIKTAYFDLDSNSPHMPSGRMSGKKGHRKELRMLRHALKEGIPAILSDATNSVRYGDICFLMNSDPIMIEVKSSSNIGSRGQRQLNRLQLISSFFAEDYAPILRQVGPVIRITATSEEMHHREQLTKSISESLEDGISYSELEPGMWLLVIRNDSAHMISPRNLGDPGRLIISSWNDYKNDHSWSPYRPFVLSLENVAHIEAFITGRIVVQVLVNIDAVIEAAKGYGLEVSITDDETFFLEVTSTGSDVNSPEIVRARLSAFHFERVFLELISCKWILQQALAMTHNADTFHVETLLPRN